jgi:mRNA-degrading endonuclease RelE of RelBE toxin-antitoxin system
MIEKHTRINITLPTTLGRELTLVSQELNDKKSHIIARALTLYSDELDTLLADSRYKKYREEQTETVTVAELASDPALLANNDEPLKGQSHDYCRLRIGHYRVIYSQEEAY